MSRELNEAILTAVASGVIHPFIGVEALFDSGPVRLWFGLGEITMMGRVFTGSGTMLNFSDIEESVTLQASGVTITISGVPTTMISLALAEPFQGRICNVYFGTTQPEMVASIVFSGYGDQMVVTESADTCTIAMTVENKLIDLERPRSRRFTHNDQISRFPGDLGLEFVESLQTKELYWGKAAPT